ncbi:MAG TPA: hypothetical protein VMK12_09315 [Anaeromyxobacteraceae bacterium]|nr:hypothetical protein [Anaeromyxobacteraceae bacterium]
MSRGADGPVIESAQETVEVLLSYRFPGNVRGLEEAIQFAAAVCSGEIILPRDLPPEIARSYGRGAGARRRTPPRA